MAERLFAGAECPLHAHTRKGDRPASFLCSGRAPTSTRPGGKRGCNRGAESPGRSTRGSTGGCPDGFRPSCFCRALV